ncbi:AMSH-like ubiquitin thioesterase 3 isoform X3 [Papaver somniferum]|uniref:AMSH-like ubiquitin thioesterase 3 isoform X3 n=1 Tax=Papaver somniferum TaxID=3469 RepID=UPI000E7038ED|nr:AMSH-like ubiquitin thioesterase 3 isoform X3 [Papaver somniferum]
MEVSVPNPIKLSFYYRIADQLITQANQCRNEKKITDLYWTINRYCSLVSIIARHQSCSTYSSEEKLHHSKICEEFTEQLELLKPQLGCISLSERDHSPPNSDQSIVSKGNIGLTSATTGTSCSSCSSPSSTFSNAETVCIVNNHLVTQSFPSRALSFVHDMPCGSGVSHVDIAESTREYSRYAYKDIHISARLMDDFMELASDNTKQDVETCGILGAFLKDNIFYVTTLIIPKQEATSSSVSSLEVPCCGVCLCNISPFSEVLKFLSTNQSIEYNKWQCQARNEEEIFAIQDEHSLFSLGWIHTHPSQTCFMSSIDLHTQFSYQVMLPEAIAVVMAPTDPSRCTCVAP